MAAGAAVGLGGAGEAAEVPKTPQPGAPRPEDIKLPAEGRMPMRRLKRTGVEVSLLGLGGFHLGLRDEATATRIVRTSDRPRRHVRWTTAGTTTMATARSGWGARCATVTASARS